MLSLLNCTNILLNFVKFLTLCLNQCEAPTGRVDCIDLISKKISNLSSELDGFHPDSQLVIDRYLDRQQTFDVNDEEQFGCGNLKTDYKVPKQIAKRDSVSTKG